MSFSFDEENNQPLQQQNNNNNHQLGSMQSNCTNMGIDSIVASTNLIASSSSAAAATSGSFSSLLPTSRTKLLKDWTVTISGFSTSSPEGRAEYNSVRSLVENNSGRIEKNLLLTCTHVVAKKGSSSKCVAAWGHNKQLRDRQSSNQEILVVTPEAVPAYLAFMHQQREQEDGQNENMMNNNTNDSNHNGYKEDPAIGGLSADEPLPRDPTKEKDGNDNEKDEEDELRRQQQQQQELPKFDWSPYYVQPLTGYTCTYTGFEVDKRADLEQKIQALGGQVSRTMTRDTVDFLIVPSGIEIPNDFGGAMSQQQDFHHVQQQQQQQQRQQCTNLNMEKLRLAEALDRPIVYSQTFLSVLLTREKTIDIIASNLAKAKRAKPVSMSQSLAQSTERILGGTNASTIAANNNCSAPDYSALSLFNNNNNNGNGNNNNPFMSFVVSSSQPNNNNSNNSSSNLLLQTGQQDSSNQNAPGSSRHSSVSPYCSQQQQQQQSAKITPLSSQQQREREEASLPPLPVPFVIPPRFLTEFCSLTQDSMVCALFTTDDQLRNLTWLMNTLGVPVVTVPNPTVINETVFVIGTELDPAYHDTVKKYFDTHYGFSDFVRSAFSLQCWLTSVAELMMNFGGVSQELVGIENSIIEVENSSSIFNNKNEDGAPMKQEGSSLLSNIDHDHQNHDNDEQQREELLAQLEKQQRECIVLREKIENQVSAIFSGCGTSPAKSLDNHPELFPNHTMSYIGALEHFASLHFHGNNNINGSQQSVVNQNNDDFDKNSMLFSSQIQNNSNHHMYSSDDAASGDDPNSSSQHHHLDLSKMVSRIVMNKNHQMMMSQQSMSASQNQAQFGAYYNTVAQNNNNNNNTRSSNQEDKKTTNNSNNTNNNNNNKQKNNHPTIEVSRNPATNSIFSSVFFIIDGCMTEECVRITKHAIHLGGGIYDRSSDKQDSSSNINMSTSSNQGGRPNKFFVMSHACQRLWGDPSMDEQERRRQGLSQDVTVDWLLHCLSTGSFIDPKSHFVFFTPVNKLKQHHLPPPPSSAASQNDNNSSAMMDNYNTSTSSVIDKKSMALMRKQHQQKQKLAKQNARVVASCYVSEPRKFFKKQIDHVGVVALIPKCGDGASISDLLCSTVTLLGGHTIKVHHQDHQNDGNNIPLPKDVTKKFTHIIFPTGNWMKQQNAASLTSTLQPTTKSSSSPLKKPGSSSMRIRQRENDGEFHNNNNNNNNNTENNNNNSGIANHDSSSSSSIIQQNIEWFASSISLLPVIGDYKSKFIDGSNNKPNPNLLYIVSQDWLQKSAEVGYFVDETEYLVELNEFTPTIITPNKNQNSSTNDNSKSSNNNSNSNKNKKVLPSTEEVSSLTQLVGSTQSITSSQVRNKLEKSGIVSFMMASASSIASSIQNQNQNEQQNNETETESQKQQQQEEQKLQTDSAVPVEEEVVAVPNLNRFIVTDENYSEGFSQSQQKSRNKISPVKRKETDVDDGQKKTADHQPHHHQKQIEQEKEKTILDDDVVEVESSNKKRLSSHHGRTSAADRKGGFFEDCDEEEEEHEQEQQHALIPQEESQRQLDAVNNSHNAEEALLPEHPQSNTVQEQPRAAQEEEEEEDDGKQYEDKHQEVVADSSTTAVEEHVDHQEQQNDEIEMQMCFVEHNRTSHHGNDDENRDGDVPPPPNVNNNEELLSSARRSRNSNNIVNRYSITEKSKPRTSGRISFNPLMNLAHEEGNNMLEENNNNSSNQRQQRASQQQQRQQQQQIDEDDKRIIERTSFPTSRTPWYVFGDGAHLLSGKKIRISTTTSGVPQQQQIVVPVECVFTRDLDMAHVVVQSKLVQSGTLLSSIASRKWICAPGFITAVIAASEYQRNRDDGDDDGNASTDKGTNDGDVVSLPRFEWSSEIIDKQQQQMTNIHHQQALSKKEQDQNKKSIQNQKQLADAAQYWRKTATDEDNSNVEGMQDNNNNMSSMMMMPSSCSPFSHINAIFWLTTDEDKLSKIKSREETLAAVIEAGGGQVVKFEIPLSVGVNVAQFLKTTGAGVGTTHLFVSDEVLSDPYVNQLDNLKTLCAAISRSTTTGSSSSMMASMNSSMNTSKKHMNNSSTDAATTLSKSNKSNNNKNRSSRSRSCPPAPQRRIEVYPESYLSKILLRKPVPPPITYLLVSN